MDIKELIIKIRNRRRIIIRTNGYFGIGNNPPSYKLNIDGDIKKLIKLIKKKRILSKVKIWKPVSGAVIGNLTTLSNKYPLYKKF